MQALSKKYPNAPGIYLMKDREGEILYIGKAKSLQKRLKSYLSHDTRITVPHLLAKVHDIDVIVTSHEKEALLLENHLIKKHQPKYNILLKDDKTFVGLTIDTNDTWPRLQLKRYKTRLNDSALHFGPYPSTKSARETLELMGKLFPLRQCNDAEFRKRTRPCLLYDMKRCLAPCMQKCTKQEYQIFVEGAIGFLQGKNHTVLEHLYHAMHRASEALEFEQAASYLTTIRHIEQITLSAPTPLVFQDQSISLDVIALYREKEQAALYCLPLRDGACALPHFYFFAHTAEDDEALLTSFLLQRYTKTPPPQKILLSQKLSHPDILLHRWHELHGIKSQFLLSRKSLYISWLKLASQNAKALFTQHHTETTLHAAQLIALQKTLHLARYPARIECIDTSHLNGTDPVTAVVVFLDGLEERSKHRTYLLSKEDDYDALRTTLTKCLLRSKETGSFPDLLLLDGGKAHLHVATQLLQELDIIHIDVCAISKEDARHDKGLTQESLHLLHQEEPLMLPARSPLLFFLQHIRDQAHKKALQAQKALRTKRQRRSSFDDLPGIGPIKKKKLLMHFGSMQKLKTFTKEDLETTLMSLKGFSHRDIKMLISRLSS